MRFKVFGILLTSALAIVASVAQTPGPKIGPARGTVFAVGGGVAPEVLTKFLEAAGGPDALIIDVPTAGENGQFGAPTSSVSPAAKWKAIGAKNVLVLHTLDRQVADSDTFIEPIKRARGVWFDGGLPEAIPKATCVHRPSPHESLLRRVIGGGASLIDPSRIFGDNSTGEFVGNLDYLRGGDLRLEYPVTFGASSPLDVTLGWQRDTIAGRCV